MQLSLSFALALTLAGCGVMDRFRKQADPAPVAVDAAADVAPDLATEIAPEVVTSPLEPLVAGQTAAALDQTTAAEKEAALATPAAGAEQALGKVVVALGSPAEQGLWLRSALVASPRKGRIVTAAGASLMVDLLPGAGAAQLSLAGFQALGLGLTDLPEVTVFGL